MPEDSKIIEREGKQYCSLPDGSQVLIETDILNDPNWITVQDMEKILGIGDRQIRNLAAKYSWGKKYAYINKKPVSHYSKKQIEAFQKERVTNVDLITEAEHVLPAGEKEPAAAATHGTGLVSPDTLKELDTILKKVEPYIGDFMEAYKKNNARIETLEEKKTEAEKTAVFWRTTSIWVAVGAALVGIAWFKADQINSKLNQTTGDLSTKYENTQQELYNTKLQLQQQEDEMAALKQAQTNSQSVNAAVERK